MKGGLRMNANKWIVGILGGIFPEMRGSLFRRSICETGQADVSVLPVPHSTAGGLWSCDKGAVEERDKEHHMKKFLLVAAVASGALFGIGAQAAPVAGLATIQTEESQSGAVQKVYYRGGWHHGYGRGGYGRGYYGRYGRWGYRRGYYDGYGRW
jgi:hypothetical protein